MNFYLFDTHRSHFNDDGYFSFMKTRKSLANAPVCPKCRRQLGPQVWEPPFSAKLENNVPGDLCAGVGASFLISSPVKDAVQASDIKGLRIALEPVELSPKRLAAKAPEYSVAFPAYTMVHLKPIESGLVYQQPEVCSSCQNGYIIKIERIRIDESTWDGQDVFCTSAMGGVLLVTERFKALVDKHAFTNFHFIHQNEYSFEGKPLS